MSRPPHFSGVVERALDILFRDESDHLVFVNARNELPSVTAGAVVSDVSAATLNSLARNGFERRRMFALLPSIENTRWLVPRNAETRIVNGLEMYPSFSTRARVYKSFAARMAALGWPGWAANSVCVSSKGLLPIEKLIQRITDEKNPQFSLSLGTASLNRKLTVQVMRCSGEIIAYLKLPLTQAADYRIQNESSVIEALNGTAIRTHVPRILYFGKWRNGSLLVQSALSGESGPIRMGPSHEHFLRLMHGVRQMKQPGSVLVRKAAESSRGLGAALGSTWTDLAAEVFRVAERMLAGREINCSLSHGDFAPWNTRVRENGLNVVDWEMATWDAPSSWDKFHFLVQTQSLLRQGGGVASLSDFTGVDHALYLLYLVSSAASLAEENPQSYDLTFREAEIRRQFQVIGEDRSIAEENRASVGL
jgi:Phosphotransferase enzyme family